MISEKFIISELKKKFYELVPAKGLNARYKLQPLKKDKWQPDFLAYISFKGLDFSLMGEVVSNPTYPIIRDKISQLKSHADREENVVPILVAPYLNPQKRKECRESGVYYMDLSGNIYLEHESLYVEREGLPNRFPEERKGRDPFADKASLIIRRMLIDQSRHWGVREISQSLSISPGFVSKMVRELESRAYVMRRDNKFSLRDPKSLLDDWISAYNYKKNRERKFFCLAKGPEEVLNKIRKVRLSKNAQYGLGIQAGANLVVPYAVYNEVHIYIKDHRVIDRLIKQMRLDEVEQGANLIVLDPYYKNSVFYGCREVEGLWVVSDIQLYLDLYHYPLRGREQAEHLYKKCLKKVIEGSDLHER